MKIGITGLMGSGKTAAGNILKKYGFFVVEGDDIAWELYKRNDIKNLLVERFGSSIIENGVVSREKMKKFFNTEERLMEIALFMSSYIKEEIRKYVLMYDNLVVVAALLCFWNIEEWFDKVILIDADDNIITERLNSNNSVIKRIKLQEKWLNDCKIDVKINNNGSLWDLEKELVKYVIKG